jgi:hypothetical protein
MKKKLPLAERENGQKAAGGGSAAKQEHLSISPL